jgi:hypothetical protein
MGCGVNGEPDFVGGSVTGGEKVGGDFMAAVTGRLLHEDIRHLPPVIGIRARRQLIERDQQFLTAASRPEQLQGFGIGGFRGLFGAIRPRMLAVGQRGRVRPAGRCRGGIGFGIRSSFLAPVRGQDEDQAKSGEDGTGEDWTVEFHGTKIPPSGDTWRDGKLQVSDRAQGPEVTTVSTLVMVVPVVLVTTKR